MFWSVIVAVVRYWYDYLFLLPEKGEALKHRETPSIVQFRVFRMPRAVKFGSKELCVGQADEPRSDAKYAGCGWERAFPRPSRSRAVHHSPPQPSTNTTSMVIIKRKSVGPSNLFQCRGELGSYKRSRAVLRLKDVNHSPLLFLTLSHHSRFFKNKSLGDVDILPSSHILRGCPACAAG